MLWQRWRGAPHTAPITFRGQLRRVFMNLLKVPAEDWLCRSPELLSSELWPSSAIGSWTAALCRLWADDGEENTTFNDKSCFNVMGMFKKSTHWKKGQVPVQVWTVFQPIKVKLTVQFTCKVKAVALISDVSHIWVQCCCFTTQTMLRVEGVRSLPQGTATGGTAETLPVKVESLCTKPFHHVNSLLTWVTLVTWWGECPAYRGNLKQHRQGDNSLK